MSIIDNYRQKGLEHGSVFAKAKWLSWCIFWRKSPGSTSQIPISIASNIPARLQWLHKVSELVKSKGRCPIANQPLRLRLFVLYKRSEHNQLARLSGGKPGQTSQAHEQRASTRQSLRDVYLLSICIWKAFSNTYLFDVFNELTFSLLIHTGVKYTSMTFAWIEIYQKTIKLHHTKTTQFKISKNIKKYLESIWFSIFKGSGYFSG